MPTLLERLNEDMKTAMKAGEKDRLETIRLILSDTKYRKVEKGADLDDADVIAICQSMVKKRRESIDQFTKGGRADLAAREEAQTKVIQSYLPEQMGVDELQKIIDGEKTSTGAASMKDMGKLMKAVQAKTSGRADGKLLADLVKKALGG
ncbi:MAG: GatB/YqeY domain-containing protein [Deltaproteobacteria bacterium]|nr:GatB/YqeY domain-containing protein [Deltaproteobacteria bacterium]